MGLFSKKENPETAEIMGAIANSGRFRAVLNPHQNPQAEHAKKELQTMVDRAITIMKKRKEQGIPLHAPLDDEKPGFFGRLFRGTPSALATAAQVGGTTAAVYLAGGHFAPETFGAKPSREVQEGAFAAFKNRLENKDKNIKNFDELPDEEKAKYSKGTVELVATKGFMFGGISGLMKLVSGAFDTQAVEQEHATLAMVYTEILNMQNAMEESSPPRSIPHSGGFKPGFTPAMKEAAAHGAAHLV